MSLSIIGKESSLVKKIEEALINAPVLGEPDSEYIHYLLHYSSNTEINNFKLRSGISCWTNTFTSSLELIHGITAEMNPASYKMIYAVKVGASDEENFLINSPIIAKADRTRHGDEYVLSEAINSKHFVKIPISVNSEGTEFL